MQGDGSGSGGGANEGNDPNFYKRDRYVKPPDRYTSNHIYATGTGTQSAVSDTAAGAVGVGAGLVNPLFGAGWALAYGGGRAAGAAGGAATEAAWKRNVQDDRNYAANGGGAPPPHAINMYDVLDGSWGSGGNPNRGPDGLPIQAPGAATVGAGQAGQPPGGPSNIYGYMASRDSLANGALMAANRAPTQMNAAPQDQFRQGQMDLYHQLYNQSRGIGPSIAQQQLQRASDANISQAMALQASQHGLGAASGLRDIAQQRSQIGQQQASDSALLRLQEQQQAQGLLGHVLGQGRGQDIGMATANMDSANKQKLLNDQLVQFYLSQGLDLDKAQTNANLQLAGIMSGNQLGNRNLDQQQGTMDWNRVKDVAGAAGGMLSTVATMNRSSGNNGSGFSTEPTGQGTQGQFDNIDNSFNNG